jgi:hypothetical protein
MQGAQIAFRLPEDLDRELREAAERNGRSVAGELRFAVQRHLERDAIERRAAAMTMEELNAALTGVDALAKRRRPGPAAAVDAPPAQEERTDGA